MQTHSTEALDRPGGYSRVGLLRPLRSRDFRILWAGMAVSLTGDGVFLIATVWAAFELWNAPAALSVLGIVTVVPTILCLLVGGVVSDRFDRRRVMACSDVARAVSVGVLALLELSGHLDFALLALLVGVYSVAGAFFTPAFEATVPTIVHGDDLAAANSLDQFVRPLTLRLAGPALGGLLVGTIGVGAAFAVEAGTFAASTVAVLAIRPPARPEPDGASMAGAVLDGLRFVKTHAWLWATLASAAVAYLVFLGPTEVLLPFVVKDTLDGSATDLGLILASGGIGAIAAAVVVAQRGQPRRELTFMYACWTVATLTVAGYGLAHSTVQLALTCFLFNALEAAGTIAWATIKQKHVPMNLLGRVSSLDWLISVGLLPVSYALTAPAASLVGVRTTLVGAAVIGTIVTGAAYFVPGVRDIEGEPRSKRTTVVTARS